MNVATLIYRSDFTVLAAATRTYLTALVAIAQTLIVEVAETTAQAGYDRADWFYQTWATAHYSDLPETQPVDEVEPDYWFEPLEIVALELEPLHRFITAPYTFVPFGLLAPASDMSCHVTTLIQSITATDSALAALNRDLYAHKTIRELKVIAKERGIKKYGSMSKARLVEVLAA